MNINISKLAATVAGAALATAGGASADTGKQPVKLNPADQAAARAVVLKSADVGPGWKGGPTKPDLTPGPRCPNYQPKVSDLVITGVAASDFKQPAQELQSQSEVLQTKHMVDLDWARSVETPTAAACFRTEFAKEIGTQGKLTSFQKLAPPRIGDRAAGFRGIVAVTAQGQTVQLMIQLFAVTRGRTELTLSSVSPAAMQTVMWARDIVLLRKLAGRAHAS
jgi:hypothetical protein